MEVCISEKHVIHVVEDVTTYFQDVKLCYCHYFIVREDLSTRLSFLEVENISQTSLLSSENVNGGSVMSPELDPISNDRHDVCVVQH